MCDQVARPLLDRGAGGRSPGFLHVSENTPLRSASPFACRRIISNRSIRCAQPPASGLPPVPQLPCLQSGLTRHRRQRRVHVRVASRFIAAVRLNEIPCVPQSPKRVRRYRAAWSRRRRVDISFFIIIKRTHFAGFFNHAGVHHFCTWESNFLKPAAGPLLSSPYLAPSRGSVLLILSTFGPCAFVLASPAAALAIHLACACTSSELRSA